MSDNIIKFPTYDGGYKTPIATGDAPTVHRPPATTWRGVDPAKVPSDDHTDAFLQPSDGSTIDLTPDQQKALNCIVSGMTFVFIGIQPTDRGASFYRAIHGDEADLRNAHDHLAAQIDNLFAAKGLL